VLLTVKDVNLGEVCLVVVAATFYRAVATAFAFAISGASRGLSSIQSSNLRGPWYTCCGRGQTMPNRG
jgi:hypothetical protein